VGGRAVGDASPRPEFFLRGRWRWLNHFNKRQHSEYSCELWLRLVRYNQNISWQCGQLLPLRGSRTGCGDRALLLPCPLLRLEHWKIPERGPASIRTQFLPVQREQPNQFY